MAERVGFEPIVQLAVNMARSSNAGIADRTQQRPFRNAMNASKLERKQGCGFESKFVFAGFVRQPQP
jgi:hypothetical protein